MILHRIKTKFVGLFPSKQTIAVVDTGLGGISVQAKLDKRIRNLNMPIPIELLYFNLRPSCGTEYVDMRMEDRIRLLNKKLYNILPFEPDIILIACNTFSAIYPETPFSLSVKIPVFNIIDFGVQMILNYLDKKPDNNVVILATGVTINSGKYNNKLFAAGVHQDQIITQVCKDLDVEIQYGNTLEIKRLARQYLLEAKHKIKNPSQDIALALCCTHYQFGAAEIEEIAEDIFDSKLTILNPNGAMSEVFQWEASKGNNNTPEVTNKIFSHIRLLDSEIQTIGSAIRNEAPAVYLALKNYHEVRNKKIISKPKSFRAPKKKDEMQISLNN